MEGEWAVRETERGDVRDLGYHPLPLPTRSVMLARITLLPLDGCDHSVPVREALRGMWVQHHDHPECKKQSLLAGLPAPQLSCWF